MYGFIGYIYLLHFDRPIGNLTKRLGQAQHYLGWAEDPYRRERVHLEGKGAAITRAAVEQGVNWQMFVLTDGDRELERQLKNLKNSRRICPICGQAHPRGRIHVSCQWRQLPLFGDDEWPAGPAWPLDWYELSYRRRVTHYVPSGLANMDTSGCDIPF